jgi:hypothetical protein
MRNMCNESESEATARLNWVTRNGKKRTELAELARLNDELYLARPFRVSHQYPKRRHYAGENWFANTGKHVWHESLFERKAMLWLDFSCDIVAIASQPMRMDFANGLTHVPDLIALHSDHRQVVYDVKPAELITPTVMEQFAETARACAAVGWGYEVISSFDRVTAANLTWLSNFRQDHYQPPEEARTQLLAALETSLSLEQAAESIRVGLPGARKGWIYHLLWVGEVHLDLSAAPITNSTLIRKAR